MAIVRVPSVREATRFKQSLSIAKMKSGILKLEILQDFYGKFTTLDKHIEEAMKDAKRFKKPEILRIPKRIQTDQCQKLSANGKQGCHCSDYVNTDSELATYTYL